MPSLTLTMLNAKLVSSTRARLHPLNSSTPPHPREREALKPSRQALILCPEDILSMTLMTVQLLRSSTVVSRCIF